MRPCDRELATALEDGLNAFEAEGETLPGIRSVDNRTAFIAQLLESIRRVKYVSVIDQRELSALRADPHSALFDPIKAAIIQRRRGDHDEACWLVFLSVHFGKHRKDGWSLARDIYGSMSRGAPWRWERVSRAPQLFRSWLARNQNQLTSGRTPRRFGNHRKYQSIDAWNPLGTGHAVQSYIEWVRPWQTHQRLFGQAADQSSGDPKNAFQQLYESMDAVATFGRTARFDYLTMLGKLSLAPIEPSSTFMEGATGPYTGAVLLFGHGAGRRRADLDACALRLGAKLGVNMQVMEDALCNWQKSPNSFVPFRG